MSCVWVSFAVSGRGPELYLPSRAPGSCTLLRGQWADFSLGGVAGFLSLELAQKRFSDKETMSLPTQIWGSVYTLVPLQKVLGEHQKATGIS